MKNNYHTHTWRCHHAIGTERAYIENAIRAGIEKLGFSDHVPWRIPGGDDSGRMLPCEVGEYCGTLVALREEYKSDIDIKIGFEAEYYPDYFDDLLALLSPYPYDYMILGQHRCGNEIGFPPNARRSESEEELALYTSQVLAGLRTGKFTYLAHPDLFFFVGDDAIYRQYMLPLCREARALGIPLEYNLLGLRNGRHYPSERFFKIAAEAKCDVILGVDAHDSDMFLQSDLEAHARVFLKGLGITPIDGVPLRDPKA